VILFVIDIKLPFGRDELGDSRTKVSWLKLKVISLHMAGRNNLELWAWGHNT